MAQWYGLTQEEVLKRLGTNRTGLNEKEAERRLETYGENVLKEQEEMPWWQVFLGQFKDLLVMILIGAAGVSMVTGDPESALVIFSVLLLNAILGTVEHQKARKSLESLKRLASPETLLIREGRVCTAPSSRVVPGDILVLETGGMVPADGRILQSCSLTCNESSLTGEALNVEKREGKLPAGKTPLSPGDQSNMVFSGALITGGRGTAVVTETGMDTQIGTIASLMNRTVEKKTPLQASLDRFSGHLALGIMVICGAIFLISLYRREPVLDALMFAVALAVAAIPEALGSIVTIVQAMGTQKMAKENAIIKKLKAVESLGCVSVICSDKTGTLTQNKMTVQQVYVDGKVIDGKELDLTDQTQRYLLYDAVLTNDSSIVDGKGIGDPTEYALLEMFRKIQVLPDSYFGKMGMHEDALRKVMDRIEEVPFDSDRKLMSTKYRIHGVPTILTKGAVDVLLDRCVSVRYGDGIRPMTEEEKEKIRLQNQHFSENGLRVLAFAYKESNEMLCAQAECGYVFLGLISMVDPPRPESVRAVAEAKQAGIKTVMITGDHKVTATAIAKQIGIFEEGDLALTGMELDAMSEEELDQKIDKISVYARVSPENKIRIVEGWQRRGNIVSMTGDGVNDAPALKKADIGVAMGITGTEVSKDAAAMILADDNFATIIKAVANGRNVYRNIKNAVLYLLSGNTAAIFAVLYTSLMALPVPFAPVQLLFINLLTDSLPALAIGMEPADEGLLKEKPRDPKEGLMTKDFMIQMAAQGVLIAAVVITAFYLGLRSSTAMASTMAFSTLTLARLFHGFNCRGKKSIFKLGFGTNPYSLYAFGAGALLLGLVIFIPGLHRLFQVQSMPVVSLLQVAVLAFIPTLMIQMKRLICKK